MLSNRNLIHQRFSCRTYSEKVISDEKRIKLIEFIKMLKSGPFGNKPGFHLIAAQQGDSQELKDLGTYGFIQGATGFIIGTCNSGSKELQDFGYQMEQIILFATSLNLGTCWLGGSFTRSTFSKKINAPKDLIIPAVTAIGEMIDPEQARKGLLRRQISADKRLPWESLFFMDNFDNPLTQKIAQEWAEPLEMVRIGPSASNKQPWRIIQAGNNFHFFLQRTRGYRESALTRFLGVADIQHLDMGIAMCHFEQTVKELNLPGKWILKDPNILNTDDLTEYIVTWEQ